MKLETFFALLLILSISNTLLIFTKPYYAIFNLGLIIVLAVLYSRKPGETYNYHRENPNARIKGPLVSGTVYSDNVDSTPQLGWVL
jgi:hypothetical protein